MAGKQPGRPLQTTSDQGLGASRLFYVCDNVTEGRYFIDTGADISAIPAARMGRSRMPLYYLQIANKTRIPVFQERYITLDLVLRRLSSLPFLVTDVSRVLIATDFLQHHILIVDVKGKPRC